MASNNSASKPLNAKHSWPEASSMKQNFSLPDSIIFYIAKNPSHPRVYLKLVQSCKYFFEKNPIIVVGRIHSYGRKFCSNNCVEECYIKKHVCCKRIEIRQLLSTKIWLTGEFYIFSDEFCSTTFLLISSKLYRCETAILRIIDSRISFDDLKLLATRFEKFQLLDVQIIDKNKSDVMLDQILEVIPHVKEFAYYFNQENSAANASTIKNILKLQNLGGLCYLNLRNVPEVFPAEDIAKFIKNHKQTTFLFDFWWGISEKYKAQLDNLIDNVIITEMDCVIWYYGQDKEKLQKMRKRFYY